MAYKSCNNLFENLKKKSKKKYYSDKISKYKHDAKKTWSIMKELIGKIKLNSSNLPRRITVNEVDIFDECKIANEFNTFFTNIRSKLVVYVIEVTEIILNLFIIIFFFYEKILSVEKNSQTKNQLIKLK